MALILSLLMNEGWPYTQNYIKKLKQYDLMMNVDYLI